MQNYLITGAAGFIGFHVSKRLLENGVQVIGIDNFYPYYAPVLKKARFQILQQYQNFQGLEIDITNWSVLEACFNKYKPDKICHLAAQPGVRYSLKNPWIYQKSNLEGFVNILELACRFKIERFVYASSSSVYGNSDQLPFREDQNVDNPISLYAATKRANEILAYTYTHLYNLQTIGLRLFTVYGPWGRPDMAIWSFADAIWQGKAISVYNHGNMLRDFTYIDDIVSGIYSALEKNNLERYEIINLGNHRPENIMKVLQILEIALNKKATLEFAPLQPGEVLTTYASIERAQTKLGFHPTTNIEVGITKFIEWFLQHKDIIDHVRAFASL